MKSIGLKLVLQAPTLIAAMPPASNLTETLSVIPGNTIRGILAQRYMDLGGAPADATFQRLFITGEVCYSFARVSGAHHLPLSARSCKYDGGFLQDNGHSMLDLLLIGPGEQHCPEQECGQAIDYFQGFWDPQTWSSVAVHTRLITRTAIDPARGTARTGQLFSQRVLEEGQVFLATVETPDDLAPDLERLVHQPYTARLGRGTSRGQGWTEVSRTDATAVQWGDATARFQQFRQRHNRTVLAVTLLSDGMFRDPYLRDATAPSIEDLVVLGINPHEWDPHPVRAFMATRMVFGFDGEPLRLPRQPRLAVEAGSVFLFAAKNQSGQPTMPAGDGIGWIGEHTHEGYGWVALWHPFHLNPDPGRTTA
jgi:CRISPR-associated Csx10 family RAMP protein